MSIKKLIISTPSLLPIPVGCCSSVVLCLAPSWADKTVSGYAFLDAEIAASGRPLSPQGSSNPRCVDVYQYTVLYDDAQLNIDPETSNPYTVTCSDVSIFPYACVIGNLLTGINATFSCSDLEGSLEIRSNAEDPCIKEFVSCPGAANEAVLGSIDLGPFVNSATLTTSCGLFHEFRSCDNELVYTIHQSDMHLVNQESHGLGAAGSLVPVRPSGVAGEYTLAAYTNDADVAYHVALVADADSYYLLDSGFHYVPSHGLTIDALYSGGSGGVLVPASTLTSEDYVQNALRPVTANCVYISLEEAQPPYPACCNIISQSTHGFSVGDVIYLDTGTWTAADAEDDGAVVVLEVYDADTFRIGLTGCLTGLAGITAGISYAVAPASATAPGTLVAVTSLSMGDAQRGVGVSPADGCLLINMDTVSTLVP